MQEQLKNIFVTKEVAKLAKEKGFNEVCAGYFKTDEEDIFPNSDSCYEFIFGWCDNGEWYIEAPTHYQLMEWLERKGYPIGYLMFNPPFDNINQNLIFALNQINQ